MTYHNEACTSVAGQGRPFRAKFQVSVGSSQKLISADCIINTSDLICDKDSGSIGSQLRRQTLRAL